jgi:hypothetical protein
MVADPLDHHPGLPAGSLKVLTFHWLPKLVLPLGFASHRWPVGELHTAGCASTVFRCAGRVYHAYVR